MLELCPAGRALSTLQMLEHSPAAQASLSVSNFGLFAFLEGLPLVPSSDGPKTWTDLTSFLFPRQRTGRMLSVTPGGSNFAVETLLLLVNNQEGPHQRGRQLCVKARKQIWLLCLPELKTNRKWPLRPNYTKSTAPLHARRCHSQPSLPTLNSPSHQTRLTNKS